MSYTYAERKKTPGAKPDAPREQTARRADAPQSVAPLSAPSRADLSEAMRARMEASFGANLSAVKSSEASNAPLSHVPAAGVSAYGGAVAPMSSASPAAGPMQAKRKKGEEQPRSQGPALLHTGDEDWSSARWGLGKRMKNWFSHRNTTGLSGKKADVESRMAGDMAMLNPNDHKAADTEDWLDETPDIEDDDNEVYD